MQAMMQLTNTSIYSPACEEWKACYCVCYHEKLRKHVRLPAIDLMTYSSVDGGKSQLFCYGPHGMGAFH